jgi:hypothetical protein
MARSYTKRRSKKGSKSRSRSPKRRSRSPKRRSRSPKRRSPKRRSRSPKRRSPKRRSRSPKRRSRSPVKIIIRHSQSPNKPSGGCFGLNKSACSDKTGSDGLRDCAWNYSYNKCAAAENRLGATRGIVNSYKYQPGKNGVNSVKKYLERRPISRTNVGQAIKLMEGRNAYGSGMMKYNAPSGNSLSSRFGPPATFDTPSAYMPTAPSMYNIPSAPAMYKRPTAPTAPSMYKIPSAPAMYY